MNGQSCVLRKIVAKFGLATSPAPVSFTGDDLLVFRINHNEYDVNKLRVNLISGILSVFYRLKAFVLVNRRLFAFYFNANIGCCSSSLFPLRSLVYLWSFVLGPILFSVGEHTFSYLTSPITIFLEARRRRKAIQYILNQWRIWQSSSTALLTKLIVNKNSRHATDSLYRELIFAIST